MPARSVTGGQAEREARHALEAHLQSGAAVASRSELDRIWSLLGSEDRGIRHAARVALEKQPVGKWKGRLKDESNPVVSTAAMIALARVDAENSVSEILDKATSIDYLNTNSRQKRLDVLRSVTLSLTRSGKPSARDEAKLLEWLDGIYPAQTPEENRDLSSMAAFLNAPFAVERGMQLLANASGQEEQIIDALGHPIHSARIRASCVLDTQPPSANEKLQAAIPALKEAASALNVKKMRGIPYGLNQPFERAIKAITGEEFYYRW